MSSVPVHPDEKARLAALHSYHILDTLEEQDFDDLAILAATICQVPVALISMVDEKRQWFKSHKGIAISETPIEQSFCAHAIVSARDIMIVEDLRRDDRFKENSLVTGEPHVAFYAGVPLVNEDGFPLGTLCVVDMEKKSLTPDQQTALKIIARQVMDKLELKKKMAALQTANEALNQSEKKIIELNEHLQVNNIRIKKLIEQAPVAIIVFRGIQLVIEAINPPMLQLLGREADVLNQPLLQAMPELAGHPALATLHSVYQLGEAVYGYDAPVMLNRSSPVETRYYNFSCTPLTEEGITTGIIGMAVEVTGQVASRRELETAKDKLNMALESAQLSVWTADIATDILTISERVNALHAVEKEESITLTESIQMIPEEHREKVSKGIENAIKNKSIFEAEYPVNPKDGSPQRWLKSNGKAYYDERGNPLYITGTILDITEQKQDDQRKNDFISMVSHELKTPLTSIGGYLQILMSRAYKNEDNLAAGMLEKANKQARKMTTMINGFLNVSRLESGKIHIDKQRFDMAELIKDMEDETRSTILSHSFIFHPVEVNYVNADRDKIGYVINNLISNAVKYAAAGSIIQIGCIGKGGNVQVCVQDEGMGISPQDIDKLFERYYRVESTQTKSIAGFGIGLYLCAEIIQRHKGRIWVESEVGKGSTFYFTLPLVD